MAEFEVRYQIAERPDLGVGTWDEMVQRVAHALHVEVSEVSFLKRGVISWYCYASPLGAAIDQRNGTRSHWVYHVEGVY